MDIVIIGGGSAGTTCAFELRKLNKDIGITILERSSHSQYSPCALPYVIGGEIGSFDDIFIFNAQDYKDNDIKLLLNSEVKKIDKKSKKIFYTSQEEDVHIKYDILVLATGSSCFVPPIPGIDDCSYKVLKTIDDAQDINSEIKKDKVSVIIGAGIIGIELAHALAQCDQKVVVVEAKDSIMPAVLDADISRKLEEYLTSLGVMFYKGLAIQGVTPQELTVGDTKISYDQLFICTGVRPNLDLAKTLGLKVGCGIIVDDYLQSSDPAIYACGDCVESVEHYSDQKILSMLGTTAVRQAKLIAGNISASKASDVRPKQKCEPVLNNTISKVGKLFVGFVGISQTRAKDLGIEAVSASYTGNVRSEYYPSKSKITIKLISDRSGILIGGQIIGHEEVVGRLNLLALAIKKGTSIKELADLETCYNPPSSPIFDPVTIVAQICEKKLGSLIKR